MTIRHLPLVGDASLDAFGDELLQILDAFLEVAVAAAAARGAERAHAAVDLVRAPSRRMVSPGLSSVPARRLPIITECAPAAALTTSPSA
jgi:hypothetical protein